MLRKYPDRVLVTEPHVQIGGPDEWEIPFTIDRARFYEIYGIPTVFFDGFYFTIGAGSCAEVIPQYRDQIDVRLATTGGLSPVRVSGNFAYDADSITVSATFEKVDPVALGDTHAVLEVLENGTIEHQLGHPIRHRHVVRAGHDVPATLANVGDRVVVTRSWPRDSGWDLDSLDCVAFLQDRGGLKEIHQGARLPHLIDFDVEFDTDLASVPEGDGVAELRGRVVNRRDASDDLAFGLDGGWGWPAEFRIEGETEFHASPVTMTLDAGEARRVWVRVATDDDLRIGTGRLVVQSAATGRVHHQALRVFNASPAVLLVDDDGIHADEAPLLGALAAAGYLCDAWDVFGGHNGSSPTDDQLRGYDISIWHEGWGWWGLDEAEQQTIRAFMDRGGGVILSGQNYLTEVTPGPFTHDYLGVGGWVEHVGAMRGLGVPGDPIGASMNFVLGYEQGHYDSADELTPCIGGAAILRSEEGHPIAVRADNGVTRSVFFAFALNGVLDLGYPNNLRTLLDRSIQWIQEGRALPVADDPPARDAVRLSLAPNPCAVSRGGVTIRLGQPGAAARLDVLDPGGRRVRGLPVGPLVTWDGRDESGAPAGAGIYYIRLSGAGPDRSARLILLR